MKATCRQVLPAVHTAIRLVQRLVHLRGNAEFDYLIDLSEQLTASTTCNAKEVCSQPGSKA